VTLEREGGGKELRGRTTWKLLLMKQKVNTGPQCTTRGTSNVAEREWERRGFTEIQKGQPTHSMETGGKLDYRSRSIGRGIVHFDGITKRKMRKGEGSGFPIEEKTLYRSC